MKAHSTFLIALFLAVATLSSRGNISPISSSIDLSADANAGAGDVPNQNSVSQTTTLNPLTNSLTVQAVNGNLSATVLTSGAANWTSASAGTFSVQDILLASNLSQYGNSRVASGSVPWIYTFNSSTPATLTLNFSVAFSGYDPYSTILWMNQYVGDTTSGTLVKEDIIDEGGIAAPPNSGSFQFSLNGGTDYTFALYDDSNLNDLPAFTSDMNATFSFQITPVPEPAPWTLMGIGALILFRARIILLGRPFNALKRDTSDKCCICLS